MIENNNLMIIKKGKKNKKKWVGIRRESAVYIDMRVHTTNAGSISFSIQLCIILSFYVYIYIHQEQRAELNEEILKENPSVCAYMTPSLDTRQDMVIVEVPKLGKEAATKTIKEWGQPKSKITHLIICTISGVHMPGADVPTRLLCRWLRLVENNKGARVLLVWSEITAVAALFGDGAAAGIVGSDPLPVEKPLFQLVWTV